jgi:heme-degrading monooxygenase HmoA
MFARTTTMQLKIAFIDNALEVYKNSIVPAAQSQKGLIELSLLLDRNSGKAVSIAIWETEEDAKANEKSLYYQEQLIKLRSFYAYPPIKEGFEVIHKK